MDNPKSKVIKSKSSNNAITTKCEKKSQGRKKSRSNAEFQTLAVKKRGVYVENKHTKNLAGSAIETNIDEAPAKPPRRPKPGSKRFLASVLTILSKSTTGTQYPDAEKDKKTTKKTKDRETGKEKKKYRSKVLNYTKNQDKFEVLQSKKEIVQTPSMYSERSYREDINFSDLPRLVKADEEKLTTVNNLVREVTEGKMLKEKKVKINEPTTLVSEQKDDSRLYNFFVDLLETTFSVYNVKADYVPPKSAVSSIAFEIDESVARKLNVGTEMVDEAKNASNHFYSINDIISQENLINYLQTKQVNKAPSKTAKRQKTESFIFTRSQPKSLPKSKSTNGKSRRNKKEDLLNILKEQLKMDHVCFEEPRNLYQALKVMAKNKRKQKIRFETSKTKPGYKPPECMLKRRKIMTPYKKSSSKYQSSDLSYKFSEVNYNRFDNDESNHSLEVYGLDYDVPSIKDNRMMLTYHSSIENSDREDS